MSSSKKKIREVSFGIQSSGTEIDHPQQLISSPNSSQHSNTFFSPTTSLSGFKLQSRLNSKNDLSHIFKNSYGLKCASGNEEKECFCYGDRKAGYGEGDLRLGCKCLVHYDCLVRYIRSCLGDRATLSKYRSENSQDGIICPYYSPSCNLCRYNTFTGLTSMSFGDENQILGSTQKQKQNSAIKSYSRESLSSDSSDSGFCSSAAKLKADDKYFISMEDIENLVNFGEELETGRRRRNRSQLKESAESIQHCDPLTKQEVDKLKAWLEESNQEVVSMSSSARNLNFCWDWQAKDSSSKKNDAVAPSFSFSQDNLSPQSKSDDFVAATTKPCPNCNFRGTHYHGHACHHISPGSGCPCCHIHYCYVCKSTAEENKRLRGSEHSCKCGNWSSFCSSFRSADEVQSYLSVLPYPHDNRCGCIVCPDCSFGSPCPMCPGQCDVCLGYINPGPSSLPRHSEDWVAQSESNILRMNMGPTIARLLSAARSGDVEQITSILDSSVVDANCQGVDGESPLHAACFSGHIEVVRLLCLRYDANPNILSRMNRLPLHSACLRGHLDIVHFFVLDFPNSHWGPVDLDSPDVDGYRPLFYAVFEGHEEIVRILALYGNVRTDSAIAGNWTPVHAAADRGYEGILHILIVDRAANINAVNKNGESALHLAAERGHTEIVRMILDKREEDIDIFIRDRHLATPLHLASYQGHHELMMLLLERYQHIVRLAAKEDLHEVTMTALVDVKTVFGKTALHYAGGNGHVEAVRLLLNVGQATLESKSNDGLTALDYASITGQYGVVKFMVEECNARISILSSSGLGMLLKLLVKQHYCIVCFLAFKNAIQIVSDWAKMNMNMVGKRHSFLFSILAVMSGLFVPLFALVFLYVKLISLCVQHVSY